MLSSKAKRELKIDQRQVLIESIEIGIASPQHIYLRGSRQLPNGKTVGLIKNSKTVNYKKFTPFRDGLFCERIFGPVTSLVCACGKKQPHSKITFCEKCEVEYIDQRSRRYRLGYISLLSPVTHIWYLKGRPSYLSLFLGKRKKTVVSLAYCNGYLIDHIPLKKEDEHQYKSSCKSDCKAKLMAMHMPMRWPKAIIFDLQGQGHVQVQGQRTCTWSPKVGKASLCTTTCPNKSKICTPCVGRRPSSSICKGKALPGISTCKKICTSLKPATFGQRKPFSVSHLSKSDNLLQNNVYKSLPFIKKTLLLQETRGRHRIALACKSKICKPCPCPLGKGKPNKSSICTPYTCSCPCPSGKGKASPEVIKYKASLCNPICKEIGSRSKFKTSFCKKVYKSSCHRVRLPLPLPLPEGHGHGHGHAACNCKPSCPGIQSNSVRGPICTATHNANSFQKKQIPLKLNRFLSNNRSVVNKRDFYRSTSYGKYFYTRQQCLPFLPSFVSHFYLRDALLNFMYSSPISDDIPILEYCNSKRIEPLQDVHKFMARQTVDKFKNVDLSVQSINSSFTAFLPKVFKRRRSVAKLSFAQRGGEPRAPSCKRVHVSATSPFVGADHILATRACSGMHLRLALALANRRFAWAWHTNGDQSEALHTFGGQSEALALYTGGGQVQLHLRGQEVLQKDLYPMPLPMPFGQGQGLQIKTGNVSKTSLSTFRLKKLYQGKKHVYLDSFFKKICKQNTVNSTSNLINKNLNEETNNTTLSNLELTAIREILSYTGGGAIQQLLKQFEPHDLCKFLVAERQILRALYQKHIAFTRDGLDLWPSRELDYLSNVPKYQDNFSIIEKPFFSTAVCREIEDNGVTFLQNGVLPDALANRRFACASPCPCPKDIGMACKSSICSPCPCPKGMGMAGKSSICMPTQEGNSEAQFVAKSDKNELVSKSLLNGFHLQEKGVFWGLEKKKTHLYQKKEIMRISRRIYKVARRLKVAQLLTLNHRRPEWMILSHLPVLPPDLRPILQMSEKVIVASDLNIMYQRVIYRNNRHLRVRFIDFQLVTAIQRLVQDAVDRLMENGKGGSKPYYTQGGRPLKSLSDILKGKKGRFRLNLLGKRVDFSGRSVIVVAPSLKIHECGLPKDIALELYHYFLLRQLIVKKYCASIVTAKKMIKSKSAEMWDVLREVMYHHPVLLNRAPTLHRLGIQAFQPKLVVGSAIWLHPLVCSGFNADFDGDQMGVHLPLSFAARAESWDLLWSRNNLLSPATGQPMLVPSQDMVLGFYYMTAQGMANRFSNLKRLKTTLTTHKTEVNKIIVFLNPKSIITNYQNGLLKLHTPVWLHWEGKIENENNSATPFELRVSGFGAQRYVFENYISNALFSGHAKGNALECKCKKICIPSASQSKALRASRIAIPCPCKSSICMGYKSKICSGIAKASFIFTQAKASYIRTTAGRVLMNNILKR